MDHEHTGASVSGEKGIAGVDSSSTIIHCWSGPRCVSTSLMYSFAQRNDTQVLDEPLYAHFLRLNPGLTRPYLNQVMDQQNADGNAVMRDTILAPRPVDKPTLYVKHMAKQRAGIDGNLLRQSSRHVLLVRRPEAVVRSFSKVLKPTLQETCYTALMELYSELRVVGSPPPIILSEDLVSHPEATLRMLCAALELPFDASMLSWASGPKPYDGVWAPWWYGTTHRSTGFSREKDLASSADHLSSLVIHDLDPTLRPFLEECRPLYEFLRRRALRPSLTDHPSPQLAREPSHSAGLMSVGTHAHAEDPRNDDVLIGIRNGVTGLFDMVWRPEARVSVLDAGFMLGDGVWEGIRLHKGVFLFIEEHLDRLYEGAKALDIDLERPVYHAQLLRWLYDTVDANGMRDGVHVRLMVTRGLKSTPYQHPGCTVGGPTIVIIPEYKIADPQRKRRGIRLFTTHVRRGSPDVQDPNWNSHSKLNCISACIQAAKAGADEALMLDPRGFVATCNSTNFFIVRHGEVWAPGPGHQLRGITRVNVLRLCARHGIPVHKTDFSLTQVYSADEAFVTGTFAGQIPVTEVDGRRIGNGERGPITERLQGLYAALCDAEAKRGRQGLL